MHSIKTTTLLLVLVSVSSSLAREHETPVADKSTTPVKIIFDTDLSGDWDDVGATATLLALEKIGSAVSSGRSLVRTSHGNPIRAAYEICCGQVGCQHANWDQTAVLAAVRDPLLYWDVVANGYCAIVDDQGTNQWRPSPDKGHRYLVNRGNAEGFC